MVLSITFAGTFLRYDREEARYLKLQAEAANCTRSHATAEPRASAERHRIAWSRCEDLPYPHRPVIVVVDPRELERIRRCHGGGEGGDAALELSRRPGYGRLLYLQAHLCWLQIRDSQRPRRTFPTADRLPALVDPWGRIVFGFPGLADHVEMADERIRGS